MNEEKFLHRVTLIRRHTSHYAFHPSHHSMPLPPTACAQLASPSTTIFPLAFQPTAYYMHRCCVAASSSSPSSSSSSPSAPTTMPLRVRLADRVFRSPPVQPTTDSHCPSVRPSVRLSCQTLRYSSGFQLNSTIARSSYATFPVLPIDSRSSPSRLATRDQQVATTLLTPAPQPTSPPHLCLSLNLLRSLWETDQVTCSGRMDPVEDIDVKFSPQIHRNTNALQVDAVAIVHKAIGVARLNSSTHLEQHHHLHSQPHTVMLDGGVFIVAIHMGSAHA